MFTAPKVIEDDKPPKTEAIEAEISIEAPKVHPKSSQNPPKDFSTTYKDIKLIFFIYLFTAPQVIEDDKPPKTEAIEAEISIEAPPISSPATAVVAVDEKPHQAEAGQPPVTPASSAVAVTSEVIASNR